MDALAALGQGFLVALEPSKLLFAAIGVLLGTAVGVLPGIGPALTVALLLPVTFKLDPTGSLIMFAGIYYGGMYGGSTTSILLNTPGESSSIMTALEGNLMAKAGRGAAALGTAAIGSFVAGTIGTLRLKNRLIMAPMGTNFGSSDGLSTERDRHYYALRAEGGVAAIVTEAMAVSEGGRAHNNSLWIYHDRFIPGLARLVQAIKAHDCLTIGQLNHRGALLRRMVLNMEPVGPSPWRNPNTGDTVRALDRAEIVAIQQDSYNLMTSLHLNGK